MCKRGRSASPEDNTASRCDENSSEDSAEDETEDEESIYDKHWMNPTLWQDAEFMDSVRKPLRIHVKVYGNSDNNWLAVAPEWQNAVGFGTDAGKALKELEQKLRDLKEDILEDTLVDPEKEIVNLRAIPVNSSRERAEKWCDWAADWFTDLKSQSRSDDWAMITV